MYPLLFQFGPLALPTYGVLVALGVLAALECAVRMARRLEVDANRVWNLGLLSVAVALAGSRLMVAAMNWSSFRSHPLWLLALPLRSGAILAGLAAGVLAGLFYARLTRLPLLRTLDVAAAPLALGGAFAALGRFAAGRGYGLPTTMPWGVTYSSRLAAAWSGTPLGVRLHPVQLYESGFLLLLFALLLWLAPRRRQDGELFGAWLFFTGLATFFFEMLRGDPGRVELPGGVLTASQLLAVGMVVAGGIFAWKHEPRGKTIE